MEKVSIVIPVYIPNVAQQTRLHQVTMMVLDSLTNHTDYQDLEIIVVDDGSYDRRFGTIWKKKYPNIKLLTNDTNLGFAKTVNNGIKNATNELVLLLNNDTFIIPGGEDWLKNMVDTLHNDKLDMTAPTGGKMDQNWNYINGEATSKKDKFSYLTGWCLLVKKEVFEKIGYIPECFGRGFWEDTLFSHRAKKAGFKLGITENVHPNKICHHFHTTFKLSGININKQYNENRKIFLEIINKEIK
jgi:O-antigen biosynthesis protein